MSTLTLRSVSVPDVLHEALRRFAAQVAPLPEEHVTVILKDVATLEQLATRDPDVAPVLQRVVGHVRLLLDRCA